MTKKELAERINVDTKTLKNWETSKPELIKLINLGLVTEEQINSTEDYLSTIKNISNKPMAMYEVIYQVLKEHGQLMTLDEIYSAITKHNLFSYGVKVGSPQAGIRTQITRRSYNSPRKDKQDEILFYQHDQLYYGLYEWINEKEAHSSEKRK